MQVKIRTSPQPSAPVVGHSEIERINLLVERDGEAAALTWVERTLKIYREAIGRPGSHAATKEYRPLFEQSIREFEEWLAAKK